MPTQVVRRGPVTDPVTAGFDTFGSFLGGYLAQKRWRSEQAEKKARRGVVEKEFGLREQEFTFRKEEHERIQRREKATQKAIVSMLSDLGTGAKDPKWRKDWRANVATKLFDYSKDPDVDIGTLTAFGRDAADWLIPKEELELKIWEEYDESTGNTVAWIIDLNTGQKKHRLGVVESDGTIAGTGMNPKDLYDIYTDLRDRYADEFTRFYKEQVDVGKYLLGTPFLVTDDTLDPEKRMQKGTELFSRMRADAEASIGSFRNFASPYLQTVFRDPKRVAAFLDSIGHVETPAPTLTPEDIETAFRDIITQQGWSGDTYAQIKGMIHELTDPQEKAYAHQALGKVLEDFKDPKAPTPQPSSQVPWQDMTVPEGVTLGFNPPMTIASDATPRLSDWPGMLARDFESALGIDVPLMEMDSIYMDGGPMSRGAIPRRRPTQMYFDIRDELQDRFPDLFPRGTNE